MSAAVGRNSPLRHITWSILGNHDPARTFVALFTAYYDASGQGHDPAVMFISGFVSTERKWLRFEREWDELLAKSGIPQPFHTTDYVAAKKWPYRKFAYNDGLRDEFERKATVAIRRAIRKPISTGLLLEDYRMVVKEYRSPLPINYRSPYCTCAMHNVIMAGEWLMRHGRHDDRLLSLFEEGDRGWGAFDAAFNAALGERPIRRPKHQHVQFQIADILAWRHAKILKRYADQSLSERRVFFPDLYRKLPKDSCRFLNADVLRSIMDERGIPRRAP